MREIKYAENKTIIQRLNRIMESLRRNNSDSKLAEEINDAQIKVRKQNENLDQEEPAQEELRKLIERSDTKELMLKRDIDLDEEVNEILPFSKLHFMSVSYL